MTLTHNPVKPTSLVSFSFVILNKTLLYVDYSKHPWAQHQIVGFALVKIMIHYVLNYQLSLDQQ